MRNSEVGDCVKGGDVEETWEVVGDGCEESWG